MGKPGRKPTAKSISEYFASGSGRKMWKEGKEQKEAGGGGIPEYDDGKYRARVVKAWSEQAQTSSRWQNVLEFKFLDGEYKGQKVRQYQGVDNPIGISILLQTFEKLGLEVEGPDDIEGADKKVSKSQPEVEIRLRTKGEYQNVFVNKLLEDAEDADEDEEDEDDDADVEEADDEDEDETPAKKKKSKSDDDDEDEDESEDDEDEDDEEDDEEEKPKKKSKKTSKEDDEDEEDEDESDDDDEDEEEPKKKKSKTDDEDEDEAEEEDEDESDDEDEDEEAEDRVALKIGMKLKVNYKDKEVIGKITKVLEKKKLVKVELKSGKIVKIKVPDEIVDVVE